MVPFIYTHSRVERETETVSSREKDQDYRPNRKETTRGERMNQKQKETEELGKKNYTEESEMEKKEVGQDCEGLREKWGQNRKSRQGLGPVHLPPPCRLSGSSLCDLT